MNIRLKYCFELIFAICLYASILQGMRIDYPRIIRHDNHYNDNEACLYQHYENIYTYSSMQPYVISSIQTDLYTFSISGEYYNSYFHNFSYNSYEDNDLTKITYIKSDSLGVERQRWIFIMNEDDDIVATKQYNVTSVTHTDSIFYEFHYQSPGKPDSIYYDFPGGWNNNRYYYLIYYTPDGKFNYSYVYRFLDNNWVPIKCFFACYNQNPVVFNKPLEFNKFRLHSQVFGTESLNYIIDRSVAADSVMVFEWSNNNWQVIPNNTFYCSFDTTNSIYTISIGNGPPALKFNDQGLLIYRFEYMSYGASNTDFFNWETITSNTDEYSILTDSVIAIYPNPFSNNLKISNSNKTSMDEISIYNIKGQLVRTWKDVKSSELTWDGKDASNQPVSSGVYLIRARHDKDISTAKVLKY